MPEQETNIVLSLDTGPIARLIEIICPTILAIVRAHTKVFGFNEAMQDLSLEILSAGTKKGQPTGQG